MSPLAWVLVVYAGGALAMLSTIGRRVDRDSSSLSIAATMVVLWPFAAAVLLGYCFFLAWRGLAERGRF